jgi:hypothetical protein
MYLLSPRIRSNIAINLACENHLPNEFATKPRAKLPSILALIRCETFASLTRQEWTAKILPQTDRKLPAAGDAKSQV